MRFRKTFVSEFRARLRALGVVGCPACGSEQLAFSSGPVVLPVKGIPWRALRKDPESDVLYAVVVRCNRCGHLMLFDSELYREEGEEPPLITGLTEAQEDALDEPD